MLALRCAVLAAPLAGPTMPGAAATPGPAAPGHAAIAQNRPANADSVLHALRALGADAKFEQKIRQPFFSVPATILEVDGEGVQVFVFRDAKAALAAAATISPDGRSIGTSHPFWIAPPHFYRRSNLLVLYLGEDRKLLERLNAVMGAQVAGA